MKPVEHQQWDACSDDTKINIAFPPPAYTQQPSSPLPPHYFAASPAPSDDSWTLIMKQPFYKRWAYLLRSWGQVFQQGRWVCFICLFCFILLIITTVVVVVGTLPLYSSPSL